MEKNDQLFMQLLYTFHTSAMQGLGKIADPTGQVNRNLEHVSQTIDLMTMLKEKSKGNISEETNPNGSINNIAGIFNKKQNILGMMPHPERMINKDLSGEHGKLFFHNLFNKHA